ncbi:FecR family protein [Novosphingobium sp. PhB165]|nr:FecR domain-containing protein [Novosphingobium sp. PhB165]TCM16605.1 FecR family protein [Novosphingobium sp. PhB165]
MESELQDGINRQAIEWHVRLRHGDDAVWAGFVEWLAEDPRHQAAYDFIEQIDLDLDKLLPLVRLEEPADNVEVGPVGGPARRWRWISAGILAASLVGVMFMSIGTGKSRFEIVTRPGEIRQLAISPGSEIVLNGNTRLTLDRKDPRFASLAQGEALFRIKHDAARPFTLEVGDNRIRDVGTVFNVVHDPAGVRVAVAEGEVIYNPGAEAVRLTAGQALVDASADNSVRVSDVAAPAVGSWKTGQLVYSSAPLSQVAADLGRSLGMEITVVPQIADRPFSGTLILSGDASKQLPMELRRIARALGVVIEPAGGHWLMKPL